MGTLGRTMSTNLDRVDMNFISALEVVDSEYMEIAKDWQKYDADAETGEVKAAILHKRP